MKASVALLLSGLAAQQVAATWNRNAHHFKTPEYNNNECTDKQKGGFNWDDLKEGDSPGNSYDGNFDFGGWKCKTAFGKRDHITKRTFGGKSLVNKISHDKPAKFGCKGKKEGFSPTEYQISTEYDTDVDLHYKMGDGSLCKQRASCKKEGTTVKNTQCGGAESVEIYIPKGSGKGKGQNGEDKEDCEIGLHHIDFDCNPGKEYTPPPAYTPTPKPECGDGPGQKPCKPEQPECGDGEGQTPCEPEEPECGDGEGQTPCEPEQPEEPECGDGEGQTPCEPEEPEEPEQPECGDGEGQTPCEPEEPEEPEQPECGDGEGQEPCEPEQPEEPEEPEQPEEPECGDGEGQEPCKPEEPEEPEEPECGDGEGQEPCEPEQPEEPECGDGEGQTPCDSPPYPPGNSTAPPPPPGSTAPPAETPGSTAPPATETPGSTAPPATETPGSYPPSGPSSTPEAPGSYPPSGPSSAPETPISSQVSPEQPAPSYPAPPAGDYTPPEVLPSCINTWLKLNTECKDNTDSECYCKIPDFTDNVLACVAAHGIEEEQSEAVQCFIGICAPAVPENPGIVTNCPTQIPINPTPAPSAPAPSAPAGEEPTATAAPGAPAPSAPAPSAPAPSYPVTTVEAGSSTYTVPQVGFTTVAPDAPGANPTEPIALYPGVTPAPAPATTTGAGAAPYPSTGPSGLTSVVAPTGTGAPTTPGLPEFEGAASPLNVQLKGALFGGAVLAFFAL